MKAWKILDLGPGAYLQLSLGLLKLWIENTNQEWRVYSEYGKKPSVFSADNTTDRLKGKERIRWVLPVNSRKVNIVPAMPDRPLVVRPEFVMKIPGGVKAEFIVGIPVWLQMLADKDHKVFEVPSEILSNTWFGPMESGELCYALKSSILSVSEPLKPFAYKVICPIIITNESKEVLDLQRICIQVKHLSVYQGQDRLWTNKVRITHRGEDWESSVVIDNKAPGLKSEFELLSEPREKVTGSFVKRTFSSIREIAGI